ncbi:MAG TPA: hypothetical protein VFL13_13195 [Candidatus Baltobacteraceae bacterium]|nr:hypothetical protein [Candidatus Baltobacteraceae bacterium]
MKTIVTVKSTPFCNSLGQHYNAAAGPMLANDRDLDRINVQLMNFDDMFHHPDYQIRYSDTRVALMKYVSEIVKSLPAMQREINQLRTGESLTTDKAEAAQLHQVAEKMQLAYNKQHQLATDLSGVIQSMMDYRPPADLDISQEELAEAGMPQEMRSVKSYLRFDGQRDVLAQAEDAAANLAIDLASTHCLEQK